MAAMAAREAGKPKLAGRVEVDDAYLGGRARAASAAEVPPARRRSWPRSRRRPNASPDGCGSPSSRASATKEIETLAKRDFAAGSNVVSDGLSCWAAVAKAGCSHFPMVTGSGPQAAKWAPFTG